MELWYPEAKRVFANPSNYRLVNRTKFRHVVVHCTDGHADPLPVAQMWQQPHHGSSAHFVIGQDGSVIQAVSLADVAYHAHRANVDSVGIEHCARTPKELFPNDPGLPYSDAQYEASSRLIAWLCHQGQQAPDRDTIQGHAEIDQLTDHFECPIGPGLDWMRLMALVCQAYEALKNV